MLPSWAKEGVRVGDIAANASVTVSDNVSDGRVGPSREHDRGLLAVGFCSSVRGGSGVFLVLGVGVLSFRAVPACWPSFGRAKDLAGMACVVFLFVLF